MYGHVPYIGIGHCRDSYVSKSEQPKFPADSCDSAIYCPDGDHDGKWEISSVFLAMAAGLADGIGFVWASAAMVVIAGAVTVVVLRLPDRSGQFLRRELKVTIPEDLDYTGIFDDIFAKYTKRASMLRVKTVNMGSLYELWYEIDLKGAEIEKTMLDEIRCRNGNLPIVCGRAGLESERL